MELTAPATPEAREWAGWNTQLKPAHEPICLTRKPCSEGTVAANVLKWRTGALNIGACRVGTDGGVTRHTRKADGSGVGWHPESTGETTDNGGRYPATLIHDGSDAVVGEFPETGENGGGRKGENGKRQYSKTGPDQKYRQGRSGGAIDATVYYDPERDDTYQLTATHADSGSAARYFAECPFEADDFTPFLYCAKASPSERNAGVLSMEMRTLLALIQYWLSDDDTHQKASNHPTVKPIRLMEWLCQLLTPPGGTILDPFMGSGTTGIAAQRHAFHFIGCELSPDYHAIAQQRTDYWRGRATPPQPKPQHNTPTATPTLF